jgi:hypothetical protein
MADVNKAVLVTFGAVGQEKLASSLTATIGKITAVTAAVGIAVTAFAKMISSADEFGDILASNTTDMSKFAERTTGLINTMDSLRGAIKAQEAGLNLTGEQIAAIGIAAEQMAIKLGEGPEGATTRFNQLIDAVIGGRERALIPYGITLEETTDKQAAQAEAVAKLTEKYGDMEIAITGADDKMASLSNTIGTVRDAVVSEIWNDFADSWVDIAANIFGGADAMRQFEQEIIATNGSILEWEYSIDGLTNRLLRNIDTIIRYGSLLGGPIGAIIGYYASKSDKVNKIVEDAEAERKSQVGYRTNNAKREALRMAGQRSDATVDLQQQNQMEQQAMLGFAVPTNGTAPAAIQKSGGGGGRRDTTVSDEELLAIQRELYQLNSEQYLREWGIGQSTSKDDLFGDASYDELTGLLELTGTGSGAIDARSEASQAGRAAAMEQQAALEAERQQMMQQAARSNAEIMLGIERDAMAEREKMYKMDAAARVEANQTAIGTVSDIFGNLADTMDESSERGFRAQKAFAISAGVIDTTLASISAFRSVMQTVPYPANVILAPITAASVMAAGMAAVAQIAKTQYGGGAQSGGTSSFSAGGLGASPTQQSGGQTIINNIVIDGQTVHSSLLNANRRASQSGSPAFAMR